MPNHPTDGAEDAVAALTAAGIPAGLAHMGGNCFSCLVPLGHDDVSENHTEDLPYLSINGDETVEADDRYTVWFRADQTATDVSVLGGVTLSALIEYVRWARTSHMAR